MFISKRTGTTKKHEFRKKSLMFLHGTHMGSYSWQLCLWTTVIVASSAPSELSGIG